MSSVLSVLFLGQAVVMYLIIKPVHKAGLPFLDNHYHGFQYLLQHWSVLIEANLVEQKALRYVKLLKVMQFLAK